MSEVLADFDKEVIRTRSGVKDFMHFFFLDAIYPVRISVPVPVIGRHLLTMSEKREIESFLMNSIDSAEPLTLLAYAKKLGKCLPK